MSQSGQATRLLRTWGALGNRWVGSNWTKKRTSRKRPLRVADASPWRQMTGLRSGGLARFRNPQRKDPE
jgi:hypothetical protein